MLNRAAILLKPLQPFIDWLQHVDETALRGAPIEVIQQESRVYLIDYDDAIDFEQWLELNYSSIFEYELDMWVPNRALWPERRDFSQFCRWVQVDLHLIVIDLGSNEELEEDGKW